MRLLLSQVSPAPGPTLTHRLRWHSWGLGVARRRSDRRGGREQFRTQRGSLSGVNRGPAMTTWRRFVCCVFCVFSASSRANTAYMGASMPADLGRRRRPSWRCRQEDAEDAKTQTLSRRFEGQCLRGAAVSRASARAGRSRSTAPLRLLRLLGLLLTRSLPRVSRGRKVPGIGARPDARPARPPPAALVKTQGQTQKTKPGGRAFLFAVIYSGLSPGFLRTWARTPSMTLLSAGPYALVMIIVRVVPLWNSTSRPRPRSSGASRRS